jgi:hypothetical protein
MMASDTVWKILSSKNRSVATYPDPDGDLKDILNFGFSYVEHTDHVLEHIVTDPITMKRMIREIEDFSLSPEEPYIGQLWTAKVYMTGKIKNSSLFFSNTDFSIILNLHLNNIK